VLFTVVPSEDRYKAKSFIDTFVYRLGDQVGAWGVSVFRWFGAGAAELALIAIPIALLWLLNALWLGRRQEKMAEAFPETVAASGARQPATRDHAR
jgi:AAA family ATP:ADP antiporter